MDRKEMPAILADGGISVGVTYKYSASCGRSGYLYVIANIHV